MNDQEGAEQDMMWEKLYEDIRSLLLQVGSEDYRPEADCWIDDDNIGTFQHKIYIRNLQLLLPDVVNGLRALLADLPGWEIVLAVSLGVRGARLPDMGLTIRRHEIVDGLLRAHLPAEFRELEYEDARLGTDRD